MAKLLPYSEVAGAAIPLPEGAPFVVGREARDLPIADAAVSREHAILECDDGRWSVRDLGSGNGTTVNGKRVDTQRLKHGDVIAFGPNARFRFFSPPPRPAWYGVWLAMTRTALVARDPECRPSRIVVGGSPVVVGRGDAVDLRVPYRQVSDVHARVENRAGRPVVSDSRSQNGTWVNGERVTAAPLWPGDEVAFADRPFDVVRTARPTTRGLVAGFAVGLLAVVVVGASLWERGETGVAEALWTRQMYEKQAEQSLFDAVSAYERRPPAVEIARAQFDIAIRSLIAADRLRPDVQTPAEIGTAFRAVNGKVEKEMPGRDAFAVLKALEDREREREREAEAEKARPTPTPPPRGMPVDRVVERELQKILEEFGIDTSRRQVPPDLLAEVQRLAKWWTTDLRAYTERSRKRAAPVLPMIRAKLAEEHLPEVFAYLPFVESGYRTKATSTAGAQGMWQFMPKTARSYGLRVDDTVDERTDPERATDAAVRYIGGLLASFGPNGFMCAVAAYNKGEYGMVSCLKKSKIDWRSQWKFWDMVDKKVSCLKPETVEYVPKFLAASIVMRRPEVFDLEPMPR